MTVAVLTTTTTSTHRQPLRVIDMAASQARPASSSAQSNGDRRRGRRISERPYEKENGIDENATQEKPMRSVNKRNAALYDEDDEGFKFTRAVAPKKPKLVSESTSTNEITAEKTTHPQSKRGRPPKTQTARGTGALVGEDAAVSTSNRRPSRRRSGRDSLEPETQTGKRVNGKRTEEPPSHTPKRGRPSKSQPTNHNNFQSPDDDRQGGGTKIALPVADTPVIRRNKEMRQERAGKGQRRSSLGMRGRRASSLIDSGTSNAIPHKEVSTAEFYKHIASEGLPEPRRMKQLLTWCATRAMDKKPSRSSSVDDDARREARVIKEQLIDDFANKSALSDWFSREDAPTPTVVVKKPNPKNIQNAEKIKKLEEQILRLQTEKQALKALLRPPSIPALGSSASQQIPEEDSSSKNKQRIDIAALDPGQRSIIGTVGLESLRINHSSQDGKAIPQPSSTNPPLPPATVSSRLSHITSSLAPTLDSFASGLHDIDIFRSAADRISSEVLRVCSQRLEERDARNAARAREFEGSDQDDKDSDKDSLHTQHTRRPREDVSVILGALSRVERR
ncbi:kinetochore protein Mis13/DSN1 [Talaromyces islandicus]|uniref:Kinetochore protein Mis13/DSN1 n=1 Tax=Talaromyces islandicus TaxID=28573 RepID=A0A0U1LRY8_TALIS|nr:kinetochore protein Mis13/DSN1 [Talaromyces islandicus]